jgi:hypothetical protein
MTDVLITNSSCPLEWISGTVYKNSCEVFLSPCIFGALSFFSAVLWASGAYAATLPVGSCTGGDAIEISIKMQHEPPISKGAGVAVSEKLVFQ